ncbi:DUF2322 family protein [Donghicola sp. C2-DW-16]|uniref:DUF2322 family protein n=1 Tax=Donghicola mangrovi TaxID=2729614 RepID=A0ABX2PHL3_9RHOB|nr:DUF2322 family protein [Donghicola mangrovi]NVO28965.1 DUF2322 family protein [Donghicola mangrovi]
MIQPTASFKENLMLLPSIDGLSRIELVDGSGDVVATIENQPGKQGSLAVYQYLAQEFGALDSEAAQLGLSIFAEHTEDAKNRPGAHPNIDRLVAIIEGASPLQLKVIAD